MPETPERPGDLETPDPASGKATSAFPSEIAAGIACVFPLVGGVVMLLLERRNRFVRFYSIQSILLATIWIVSWVAAVIAMWIFRTIPFIGSPLAGLLWFFWGLVGLVFFVVWLVQLIKAFTGTKWEIPYLGDMANDFLESDGQSHPTAEQ